jgi:hypothetical protein
MAEFKKGDRIVFTKDDAWWERGELVARMPAGTLGTYLGTDDDAPDEGAPWVRLDTGEHVLAWADVLAPVEDHGTGDGSASDICAEPGWRRLPAPVVDDLWDAKDRVQREVAAEVFTAPAPLDPSGRHELAADFFHAKTGTAASYFTVDLSPEERAPYYAAADAFLATQPTPEPEPEWKPGTLVAATMDDGAEVVGFPTVDGYIAFVDGDGYETREARADARSVRPLVVLDPESDTDRLAAIIRLLRRLGHDGNHDKGAAEFAEAILERLSR